MTVDQNVIRIAPDSREASSWFGWLSAEDINEALDEPDDRAKTVPGSLMALPPSPAWPRVFPGL
jgi:hypothetical protein